MSRSASGHSNTGTRQRSSRTKRQATLGPRFNMGQATEHAIGGVLKRIRKRISELSPTNVQSTATTNEENGNGTTDRGMTTGINGVTEDFPVQIDHPVAGTISRF